MAQQRSFPNYVLHVLLATGHTPLAEEGWDEGAIKS